MNKILVFFILLFHFIVKAQVSRDTIMVYDTIVVRDTIWIDNFNNKIKAHQYVLQLDTLKNRAQVMFFDSKLTATIPINSIIYNEQFNQLTNSNSENMKKLNFLGIMLIAFKSMVLAQSDYGVSVGTKTLKLNSNLPTFNSPYNQGVELGGFFKYPVFNKNFSVGVEANYAYIFGSSNYALQQTDEIDTSLYSYYNTHLKNTFETGYHQISLPIYLTWEQHKIKPFLGVEYAHLRSANTFSIETLTPAFNWEKYAIVFNNFNLKTGLQYTINEKISVNLNYKIGVFKENLNYKTTKQTFGYSDFNFRNNQMSLALQYHFGKTKLKEQINKE